MRTLANASLLAQMVLIFVVVSASSCTAMAIPEPVEEQKQEGIKEEPIKLKPGCIEEELFHFDELGVEPIVTSQPCTMIAKGG